MAFRKAKSAKIGGKFLAYGETGSGKSWFQLTFPDIACVDSETGIGFYEDKPITLNNGKTYNNLRIVDNTSDLDTLENDLDEFLEGEHDDIQTFAIDSETKFYSTMQISALEVEERRARRKGNNVDDAGISIKQWGRIKLINMKFQQAKIDLSSKGVHIVSIAQQAEVKDDEGKKTLGYKPDMYKSVGFDYDVVLHFFKEQDKSDKSLIHYYAEIIKDRTNVTKVGSIIENPSYDIWKDFFEGISSLETHKTSYKNDLNTSTQSMADKADTADDIIAEWKPLMKSLSANGNTEGVKQVNKFIKDKEINVKNLALTPTDILQELLDLTKSLSE